MWNQWKICPYNSAFRSIKHKEFFVCEHDTQAERHEHFKWSKAWNLHFHAWRNQNTVGPKRFSKGNSSQVFCDTIDTFLMSSSLSDNHTTANIQQVFVWANWQAYKFKLKLVCPVFPFFFNWFYTMFCSSRRSSLSQCKKNQSLQLDTTVTESDYWLLPILSSTCSINIKFHKLYFSNQEKNNYQARH